MHDLPMVYLFTGLSSIFAGPLLGRLTDRIGGFRVFAGGSVLSISMVLVYTHLGVTPLWQVILVSIVMFMGISSRMISFQALVSAVPDPLSRGAFMAVNSSTQQISGGIASAIAGMIVVQETSGSIGQFDVLGYVVVVTMVFNVVMLYFVNRFVEAKLRAKTLDASKTLTPSP